MNDDEKQVPIKFREEVTEVFIDDLEYAATTKSSCKICYFYKAGILNSGNCTKIKRTLLQGLFPFLSNFSNIVYEHDCCYQFLVRKDFVPGERFRQVVSRCEAYRKKEEEKVDIAEKGIAKAELLKNESPMFEIMDNTTGVFFKIYADGRTEGFPESCNYAVNRFYSLCSFYEGIIRKNMNGVING